MKAAIVSIAIVVTVFAVSACEERLPMTPLAGAARRGDVAEIDRLIAAGADVNEHANLKGWPPIIHAIRRVARGGDDSGLSPAGMRGTGRGASHARGTRP
jgi:hypothetical protein